MGKLFLGIISVFIIHRFGLALEKSAFAGNPGYVVISSPNKIQEAYLNLMIALDLDENELMQEEVQIKSDREDVMKIQQSAKLKVNTVDSEQSYFFTSAQALFTFFPQREANDLRSKLGDGWVDPEGIVWFGLARKENGELEEPMNYVDAYHWCKARKARLASYNDFLRIRNYFGYELAEILKLQKRNVCEMPQEFSDFENRTFWVGKEPVSRAQFVVQELTRPFSAKTAFIYSGSEGVFYSDFREENHWVRCVISFRRLAEY